MYIECDIVWQLLYIFGVPNLAVRLVCSDDLAPITIELKLMVNGDGDDDISDDEGCPCTM